MLHIVIVIICTIILLFVLISFRTRSRKMFFYEDLRYEFVENHPVFTSLLTEKISVKNGSVNFIFPHPPNDTYFNFDVYDFNKKVLLHSIPYVTSCKLRVPEDLPVGDYVFGMRIFGKHTLNNRPYIKLSNNTVKIPELNRSTQMESTSDEKEFTDAGNIFNLWKDNYEAKNYLYETSGISESHNFTPLIKIEEYNLQLTSDQKAIIIFPHRRITIGQNVKEYIGFNGKYKPYTSDEKFIVYQIDGSKVRSLLISQLILNCSPTTSILPFYIYIFSKV